MINEVLTLSYYSTYYSGQLGNILNQLEQTGFFDLLLPFLLIFALVFGILTQIKLFKETKAINAIIALAVGLMAMRFQIVTDFFSQILPRTAIGLIVILVVIILLGLFLPHNKGWVTYGLVGVAGVVLVIVLIQTAGNLGWTAGYWWYDNWPWVAGAVFILIIIAIIVGSSTSKTPNEAQSIFSDLLKAQ